MGPSIAVVGPGRVGTALAALWHRGGADLLGFVGRRVEDAARAAVRAGGGRALAGLAECHTADCVVLAVPDAEVGRVAAAAGGDAVRRGALWLHTSGALDLSPLEPLMARGAAIGSLHPVCPVPDVETGIRVLPSKPCVLSGDPAVGAVLEQLAEAAGLRPVWASGGDRALYHAACALAANAGTALFGAVEELLAVAVTPAEARALTAALMAAAVEDSAARGAAAALSGPVRRGERDTVTRHIRALAQAAPQQLPLYRALMRAVAALAERGGSLSAAQRREFDQLLGD